MAEAGSLTRWLTTAEPGSRLQARLGHAFQTFRRLARNPTAMAGLAVVLLLVFVAAFAPLLATHSPVVGGDLRTQRLLPPGRCSGSAPTTRRATSIPPRLRLAADARRRRPRLGDRDADRPRRRHGVGLLRRLDRPRADADHRHLPRLPAARAGARLRRGARSGHRERDHRHRHHRLAALCAPGAGRDAHHPQQRFHPCRAAAGRLVAAHPRAACRAALPVLGDRAGDARHGRHHPRPPPASAFSASAPSRRRRNGAR